jgi:acetyltransferase-like isoleucine patch superfamily enzyme
MIFEKLVSKALLATFRKLVIGLSAEKKLFFNRHVPLGDLIFDRHVTAQQYGFGEGTTCYDSVLILGDVRVGKNSWIGPNVVLDGTGGLEIGDFVSISAGVQIYSHSSVNWSQSLGLHTSIESAPTRIGNGVYIGPNAVIQMGISVGEQAIIGALSFVNKDVPSNARAYGVPAQIITK